MPEHDRDVFGRSFVLRDDILQRDVVTWNRVYVGYGPVVARADERQAALQAAIAAGWIVSPETRAEEVTDIMTGATATRYLFDGVLVDDLTPAEVNYYGGLCSRKFDALMSLPKATSSV